MNTADSPLPSVFDHAVDLHAPELYRPGALARQVETLADIGGAEVSFYHEHGYLAVKRAFSPEQVQAALDGLIHLVMGKVPEFRGIMFEAAAREKLADLGPEERQDAVRKLYAFVGFEPRLKAISADPALVAAVETLLGGAASQMFQDMALIKPPRMGREKPWHQDHAYFDFAPTTPVVGVWIALDPATIENGCMQLLPGLHRDGPRPHFMRRDWQLCDNETLGRVSVASPLEPGGLLFFDGLLPHGTPHNSSPRRRRALQFHYAPADAVHVGDERRLATYGGEGKGVTC